MQTCSNCRQVGSECVCEAVDTFFKANGYLMEGRFKPKGMPALPEKVHPEDDALSSQKVRDNLTN